MKCLPQPCNTEEDLDRGISGTDPRFTSDVIDQMKGVNYPDELIQLVESQYLRYGNRIKLQAKSFYSSSNDSSGSCYLGVYEKPSGTKRMAVPPVGNAPGIFKELVYRIVDPVDSEKDDFVYYGDVIVLVDESGMVWNCKNYKGSLDGYLSPQPRGKMGEIFVSFAKTGKQGEPIVYGEPGVKIQVEESNRFRNTFAGNQLTNLKKTKSKFDGGYVACNGTGHLLNFFIHPESGEPDGSYVKGTTTLSLEKSKTSKLMNFLNNDLSVSLDESTENTGEVREEKVGDSSEKIEQVSDEKLIFQAALRLLFVYSFLLSLLSMTGRFFFHLPLELENIFTFSNILIASILTFSTGLCTPLGLIQMKDGAGLSSVEDDTDKALDGFVVIDSPSDTSVESSSGDEQVIVRPAREIDNSSWRAMGKDENGVPLDPHFRRFLEGEFGNMKIAKKRWEVTCDWRESNDIDNILEKEYILFEVIKSSYPHYILGRCKEGYPVYIENPGTLRIKKLYEAGVCVEDMLFHNIYISEFIWKVLEPEGSPNDRLCTILDMSGIRFKDIFGDVLSALKSATSISQTHYPERSYKIFVINVPRWFDVIFKIIKPFVAEATLQKVRIYRHGYEKELLDEIDASVLPVMYGGTNKAKPYENDLERELWLHVYQHCIKSQKKMINSEGKEDAASIQRMKTFVSRFGKNQS